MCWVQILLALVTSAAVWMPKSSASPARLAERAEEKLDVGGSRAQAEATELFRRALAGDAASPFRWCDLGETLEDAGREQAAGYCFRRAIELGPDVPPVLMRAANYDLTRGEVVHGLAETNRILTLTRDYDSAIFGVWRRMGVTVADALTRGLPPEASIRSAYLADTLSNGSLEEATAVWRFLEAEGQAGDRAAADYTDFLLAHQAYGEAAETWRRHFGRRDASYGWPNLVFNGGFETEPLGGGLDWKIDPTDGATATRDAGEKHGGAASLRLSFDGTANVAYRNAAVRVVASGGHYRFSAFAKAGGLTTDRGVQLCLSDTGSPAGLELCTPEIRGAAGWERMTLDAHLPPGTHLLEIRVVREPSLKFDNKIGGRVWIDDVELAAHPVRSRAAGN